MNNEIMTIRPYKVDGNLWVFDDAATGLVREAFVGGADTILDMATEMVGGDPKLGLSVAFSAKPFPGHQIVLEHKGEDEAQVGNTYFCPKFNIDGWFCPALLLYFPKPPKKIYAQFKKISQ